MKRTLLRLLALLVIIAVLGTMFIPGFVESKFNKVRHKPPYAISDRDQSFWNSLSFVADLHSDALLWGRNLNNRSSNGHVDIPRLMDANVALQVFTIVSKTPKDQNYSANGSETDNITALMVVQGRNPNTWNSLFNRGTNMAKQLHKAAADNEAFRVIHSQKELKAYTKSRQENPKQSAGLLGVEGLHLLEGKLENVQKLYDAGFRMVAPVHFFDNEVGGSAHGLNKGGLTDFGKKVLAKAEELKMLIDISHASPQLIDDVLNLAKRPVIVSHTGVQATCPGLRNLSDQQLKRIAKNGGIVGIAMFKAAVCSEDIQGTAKAIRHAADVMGYKHVALGSDFDGAVVTPFDVTGLPKLVKALRAEGFTEKEMKGIFGENVKNLLLAQLPEV